MIYEYKPMVHTVKYDDKICRILTVFDRPVIDDFWFYAYGEEYDKWRLRIVMRLIHEGRFTSEPLSLSGLTIADFHIDLLAFKDPHYRDAAQKILAERIAAVRERDAKPLKQFSPEEAVAFVDQFLEAQKHEK